MRMAELSAESGVPVATIKYYLREGLVPPGELTSPNQAQYQARHLQRLKLVRALLDVGGLSIVDVREVVRAIDEQAATHELLGAAQHGLIVRKEEVDEESRAWAMGHIEEIAAQRQWTIGPDDVYVKSLVGLLCTLRDLGHEQLIKIFPQYAECADSIAQVDLEAIGGLPTPELMVESAVVGTVLGDAVFIALRRLAQQHASRRMFGVVVEQPPA
ncbi:MerR family transcriptional regulator [Umezawaea tangerina]|uniref:DNA-binding transcriptional MerR regulator n=1 Tax=Umezawaea tangerina TaxID=84725 RepID=A0A2T0SWY6_9PSEU|nr:MerR family transcriptional regulator [Umezawaea tangerina]PRY37936.1 DNA-binding transcriptional MerR regulator [Umezawaea tangerina]